MGRFRATGRLAVEDDQREAFIRGSFRAARFDDSETMDEIARVHRDTGLAIDPHTATATAAARLLAGDEQIVTLATAHPAKFPDAVARATGHRPPLPDHLADLVERPERTRVLPADLAAVQGYVRSVARIVS